MKLGISSNPFDRIKVVKNCPNPPRGQRCRMCGMSYVRGPECPRNQQKSTNPVRPAQT